MSRIKDSLKLCYAVLNSYRWRIRANGAKSPRFTGVYDSHAEAMAVAAKTALPGYDHEEIADVSFDFMKQIAPWDYPVLFWLKSYMKTGTELLDMGGHMGTKYLAFQDVMDLTQMKWTVLDLPAIISTAQDRQKSGELPKEITFTSTPSECAPADLLLASGLLLYLDQPLAEVFGQFSKPPQTVILNKVALRDGPSIFTLELIGGAKVPYQIRSKSSFEAEIAEAGYDIKDTWGIPTLGHSIITHPLTGVCQSRGYLLERRS